jgi:hypothetical protein
MNNEQTDEVVVSYSEAIVGLGVVLKKLNEALAPYDGYATLSGSAPDTSSGGGSVRCMLAQIQIEYDPWKVAQDILSPVRPSGDSDQIAL